MRHISSDRESTTSKQHYRMSRLLAIMFPLCLAISLSGGLTASAYAQVSPNDTVTRVLNGTTTAWSDNALFAGPASQTVAITIVIDTSTGACTYSFPPFQLTDPSSGNTITVSQAPGTSATGQFDASTGSLVLTGTLELQNVPLFGTVTTDSGSLSTESTITAADGTTHSGQRLDASNNIALVGVTSFTDIITVNIQLQVVGVLSPAS